MATRTSSAPRTSRAAKGAAANKAATPKPAAPKASTALAVVETEDVVLEGVIVDDVPADATTTKKARIDHSTHAHAHTKAGRASCRLALKKAAAASEKK